MFRRVSIVALVVMVVVGSLAVATAAEPKTDGKTKSPPKELTVDIGKGIKLEMVLIPAGEFMMGAPDSEKAVGSITRGRHWMIQPVPRRTRTMCTGAVAGNLRGRAAVRRPAKSVDARKLTICWAYVSP